MNLRLPWATDDLPSEPHARLETLESRLLLAADGFDEQALRDAILDDNPHAVIAIDHDTTTITIASEQDLNLDQEFSDLYPETYDLVITTEGKLNLSYVDAPNSSGSLEGRTLVDPNNVVTASTSGSASSGAVTLTSTASTARPQRQYNTSQYFPDISLDNVETNWIQDEAVSIRLPLTINSTSSHPIKPGSTCNLTVALVPVDDSSNAQVIHTENDLRLNGLRAGGQKRFNINLTLPEYVDPGEYHIRLSARPEFYATARVHTTSGTITVEDGQRELAAHILHTRLPQTVVAQQRLRGSVTATIRNEGNLNTDPRTPHTFTLHAVSADGTAPIVLAERTQRLGRLQPDATRKVHFRVNTTLVDTGLYTLAVTIDTNSISAAQTNNAAPAPNNDAASAAAQTLEVEPAYHDLSLEINEARLRLPQQILETQTPRIRIPIQVTLEGNTRFARGATYSVETYINTPEGEVVLAARDNLRADRLRPGRAQRINLLATLPDNLDAGTHDLKVRLAASPQTHETNANDNASDNNADAIPLNIQQRVDDLGIEIHSTRINYRSLPSSQEPQALAHATGRAVVNITHQGNARLSRTDQATVELVAISNDGQSVTSLGETTVNLRNMKPGSTKRVTIRTQVIVVDTPEGYSYGVRLLTRQTDSNPANNVDLQSNGLVISSLATTDDNENSDWAPDHALAGEYYFNLATGSNVYNQDERYEMFFSQNLGGQRGTYTVTTDQAQTTVGSGIYLYDKTDDDQATFTLFDYLGGLGGLVLDYTAPGLFDYELELKGTEWSSWKRKQLPVI
ncbi:hypothetical protein [Mucisphaera calidilacus]|uniref:Uncharacterized protein n=1 Tax=Mucisphaera calidilacus TaxID=2527982 RepID=A0A518C029_9BACT|nr:hypothetical protein [Mucisphaera calidilacus]QDU72578.1 hypothetical protein Pan265_24480 [Mucisphaera calidilacus]